MAITDQKTVLILGAGASKPFGIPVGGELIEKIRAAILDEDKRLRERDDSFGNARKKLLANAATRCEAFESFPIHGAVARRWLKPDQNTFDWTDEPNDTKLLKVLAGRLENQTAETIDDFIVNSPDIADVTKLSLAAIIFKLCHTFKDPNQIEVCRAKLFEARKVEKGERNWVHLLINMIRHGVKNGSVSPKNKIQIVTFNYDTILEYVLEKQFTNTGQPLSDYREYVDVRHVHGAFGALEHEGFEPAKSVQRWAKELFVCNEEQVPQDVQDARAAAFQFVTGAREIYVAGFSFAASNCRLIGFPGIGGPNKHPTQLVFCNYDGNAGMSKAAQKYQRDFGPIIRVEEIPGTVEKPLSISDWIKGGYLGELP